MSFVATSYGTYYFDDRADERYCFWLVRLVGGDAVRLDDDVIATLRVPAEKHTAQRFAAGMRAWALATLAAGGYGFGRYEVSMGVLDDEDAPDDRFGREVVDWDGATELVPATA